MESDVFNKLRALTINVVDGGVSQSISDKEYTRLYINGKREGNMHKQYEFINAMERGGLNFPEPELVYILKEAFEIDEDRALFIINDKTDILTIAFIGYGVQESIKKHIIKSSAITNPIVKYEMIRQILKTHIPLENSALDAVTRGCVQLSEMDAMVFSFMLNELQCQSNFFIMIGRALNSLSDNAIKIYAENINLQRGVGYFEQVNTLLEQIEKENWDKIFSSITEIIYRKWNDLLDKSKAEKGIDDIIICSYSNLILCCMLNLFSNQDNFFIELNDILETCDKYLYTWHSDSSVMKTAYFVYATKLYMLRLIQINCKFTLYKDLNDKLKTVCGLLENYRDYWKYTTNGKTLEDVTMWNTYK